jgi:predicted ATPase
MEDEVQALSWAEHTRHLGSRVHGKGLTLLHRVYRRDFQEVFDRAGELVAFTAEHGIADHGASGLIFRGWVIATQEDPVTGLRMIEEGLARQRATATDEDYSVYLCLLAEALIAAKQADRAVELLLRERHAFEQNGFQIWVPELLRVTGEAMLAADPDCSGRARAMFDEAAALANRQNAPMLELRIAMSEARLATRLGDARPATARLCAALNAIPQKDRSADIAQAEELIRHEQGVQTPPATADS